MPNNQMIWSESSISTWINKSNHMLVSTTHYAITLFLWWNFVYNCNRHQNGIWFLRNIIFCIHRMSCRYLCVSDRNSQGPSAMHEHHKHPKREESFAMLYGECTSVPMPVWNAKSVCKDKSATAYQSVAHKAKNRLSRSRCWTMCPLYSLANSDNLR